MGYNLKNKDEYNAFKPSFLALYIKWEDCKGKDIIEVIKSRYHYLSKKFHPDKNVNVTRDQDQNEEKIREINRAKEVLYEFILEPLNKGLSKRSNLVKELRNKLWKCNDEELQSYLNEKSIKTLKEKKLSMSHNVSTYSKYSSCSNLLGKALVIFTSIAFLIINGISCNIPIAVGFFISLLVPFSLVKAIEFVYDENEKECGNNNIASLLLAFDEECKDFSENDRTKLKWLKNSIVLNDVICTSLMFCGVGLDLVANGFGVTNSVLLSGLLLSLPFTLLIVASSVDFLDTAWRYIFKKTAINLIEGQLRGDDKSIEIENENNPKSFVATGCFSSRQLAITYPQVPS